MAKIKSKKQTKPNSYSNSPKRLRNKLIALACTCTLVGGGIGAGAYYGIDYAINQHNQLPLQTPIEQPVTPEYLVPDIAEPSEARLFNCLNEVNDQSLKMDTGVMFNVNVFLNDKIIDKVKMPIILEKSNPYLYENLFDSINIVESGDIYIDFTDYANLRFKKSAYELNQNFYKIINGEQTMYLRFNPSNFIGEHPTLTSGFQNCYINATTDTPPVNSNIIDIVNNEIQFDMVLSR